MRFYMLACVLAGSVLASPTLAATKVIGSLDGYCDGFILTLKSNGAVAGKASGCSKGLIAGLWNKKQIVLAPVETPFVILINANPRTFFTYNAKGKLVVKGTWSAKSKDGLAKSDLPSALSPGEAE